MWFNYEMIIGLMIIGLRIYIYIYVLRSIEFEISVINISGIIAFYVLYIYVYKQFLIFNMG